MRVILLLRRSLRAGCRRRCYGVTSWPANASEPVEPKGPHVDERRPVGGEIGNEPACNAGQSEAEMAVAKGEEEARAAGHAGDDRERIGCRWPEPHPFGRVCGVERREEPLGAAQHG